VGCRRPGRVVGILAVTAAIAACASSDGSAERAARPVRAPLPMAARHLPEGCHAVVHFDLSASRTEATAAARSLLSADAPERRVLEQARALGNLDLERDLTSALVCHALEGERVHTLLVAGGDFPGAAVVPALEGALDGVEVTRMAGLEVASFLVEGHRWFAGQAADGAIVLGDHEGLVQSALPEGDRAAALGMRFDAPISVRADGPVIDRAARAAGAAPEMIGATRVVATGGPTLTVRVDYPTAARANEAAAPLRELLDRRLGESTRVVARALGAQVVVDVDSTHFARSWGP
jgi:hypothetical protein